MKKFLFLLFFPLCIFAVACSTEDLNVDAYNISQDEGDEDSDRSEDSVFINVLIIGNSLSRDAFSYVPFIMENSCVGLKINVSILYIGGVALSTHWDYLSKGKNKFLLDSYSLANGKWVTTSNVDGSVVIQQKWNFVMLQEGSVKGRTYAESLINVDNFKKAIKDVNPEAKIAYMINPPHADGDKSIEPYSSDDIWEMFARTAGELLERNDVDYIIPCGTAIQNARHTYLDALGDFGHLSYDGVHLQEGIPCLIDAYTVSQSLINLFDLGTSINNNTLQVNQEWVKEKNIPGQHGKAIIGSSEDYELCKRCALAAVENPFCITTIQ